MTRPRDVRRGSVPKDVNIEDGHWLRSGHRTGRAGAAPGRKGRGTRSGSNPRQRGLFRTGPSRGTSRTGNDRRGGWLFGGGNYTDPYL